MTTTQQHGGKCPQGVQHKSLVELAHELVQLQAAAAANKLPPEVLAGGTVTVSNIGATTVCNIMKITLPFSTNVGTVGGTYATPRVTPPQSAILALGRVQQLPRFAPDGSVTPAAILRVSWGADHRVTDGATLAHCNNVWKGLLEVPDKLLLCLR